MTERRCSAVLVATNFIGALHRLSYRLCFAEVVLSFLSYRIGAHVFRGHQPGMTEHRQPGAVFNANYTML